MTEPTPPPPKDYNDRAPQQSEQVAEQVAGVLKTVGKQKPELLWILLLVIVIEGAQIYETTHRVEATQSIMREVIAHIQTVEANRQEEGRRMQENNRMLVHTIARRSDRNAHTMAEPIPGE
jgi:hypothetical protein